MFWVVHLGHDATCKGPITRSYFHTFILSLTEHEVTFWAVTLYQVEVNYYCDLKNRARKADERDMDNMLAPRSMKP